MVPPEEWADLGARGLLADPPGRRLAYILHEQVVQRLCGIHFALGSSTALDPADVRRCMVELEAAIASLRTVIREGLDDPAGDGAATLGAVVREAAGDADVHVSEPADVELAPAHAWLIGAFVAEAVRNALKHAAPSGISVTARRFANEARIVVSNDGVARARPGPGTGVGLELLAAEARLHGGTIEAGPAGGDTWRTRLVLPVDHGDVPSAPRRRFGCPR